MLLAQFDTMQIIRGRGEKLVRLPWALLAVTAALICVGLVFIYSASNFFSDEGVEAAYRTGDNFVFKQLFFACVGGVGMVFVATSDYRKFAPIYHAAFLFGMFLLIACVVIGKEVNGAKSWIMIGPFGVQVAEYCKLCYILTLAGFLRFRHNVESFRSLLLPLIPTFLMLAFILKQPDFGTAMVFVPVYFAIMWTSGARLSYILPMLGIGGSILPAAYFLTTGGVMEVFKPHQMERINTWLASLTGGALDRSGEGYHITMSMNAIGSGGFSGTGYGQGTLSQYDYLPERHTDFIFSVISEELGFLGVVLVFALYFAFIALTLRVATQTREPFGRMICVGVATMFFAHFMINVGMTCGVMPVTGIPLAFISYGGSSLMTSLLAIGMVVSVHLHPTRVLGFSEN